MKMFSEGVNQNHDCGAAPDLWLCSGGLLTRRFSPVVTNPLCAFSIPLQNPPTCKTNHFFHRSWFRIKDNFGWRRAAAAQNSHICPSLASTWYCFRLSKDQLCPSLHLVNTSPSSSDSSLWVSHVSIFAYKCIVKRL